MEKKNNVLVRKIKKKVLKIQEIYGSIVSNVSVNVMITLNIWIIFIFVKIENEKNYIFMGRKKESCNGFSYENNQYESNTWKYLIK